MRRVQLLLRDVFDSKDKTRIVTINDPMAGGIREDTGLQPLGKYVRR